MIYPVPKPDLTTGMRVWGIYSCHGANSYKGPIVAGTNWDTLVRAAPNLDADRLEPLQHAPCTRKDAEPRTPSVRPSLPKAERDITLSTFVPQDIRSQA
jgi:hypothetical protein